MYYFYCVEKYTTKQVSEMLGVSERTIKYYRGIYSNQKYIMTIDRNVFHTQAFVDLVRKNRELNSRISTEPRTKEQLLKEIEELQQTIQSLKQTIIELEESGEYEIAENERIEIFTQEEYDLFSERLIQWRLQRQEIEQKNIQFESIKEERDFIKNQLEYFKVSNDKILQQHQNLIEIIGQRNRIEAVEKGAIPREPRTI